MTHILTLAARVYDKDSLTPADEKFLNAIAQAGLEWGEALDAANRDFGGGSEAWHCVRRLADRTRDQAYERALAEFEARGEEELFQLEAAE